MSKISDIIKAHESGANLHFLKKAEMELGVIYPVAAAIKRSGKYGEEIRVTLTETDTDGKHFAVTTSAKRNDGEQTQFAQMYDEFIAANVEFTDLGVVVEETTLFDKPTRMLHFVELVK